MDINSLNEILDLLQKYLFVFLETEKVCMDKLVADWKKKQNIITKIPRAKTITNISTWTESFGEKVFVSVSGEI